jgi:hypothetical protein
VSCSSSNGSIFKAQSPQECYEKYLQIEKPGYKAFALAIDYPFFICGLSGEMPNEKYAVEIALYSCEKGRISPGGEISGERAVMTDCRIYASGLIE